MDRKCGCTGWIFVCYHVEIEESFSILTTVCFHNTFIDTSSRTWVDYSSILAVVSFKKSCCHLGVHKDVEDLWIIVWCKLLNCLSQLASRPFILERLLSHSWPTNSISVNNNLLRLNTLILRNKLIKRFLHKYGEDLLPVFSYCFFLLVLCHAVSNLLFVEVLISNLAVVLSQISRVACGHSDNGPGAHIVDVNTNYHRRSL